MYFCILASIKELKFFFVIVTQLHAYTKPKGTTLITLMQYYYQMKYYNTTIFHELYKKLICIDLGRSLNYEEVKARGVERMNSNLLYLGYFSMV